MHQLKRVKCGGFPIQIATCLYARTHLHPNPPVLPSLEIEQKCIKMHQAEFPCFPHSHDCKLSQWTSWSTCSSTVGYGVSYRKREVESPAGPQGNGCVGVMKEIFPCSLAEPEAIDCLWGEWSQWSGCSCSCGGGSKRRSRAIAMSPQNGGQPCNPQDKEVIAECNTQKCSENCEDGYWSAWLDWSKCSATCSNGYRSRRRTLDVLPNACGSLPLGEHKDRDDPAGVECSH